MRRVAPVSSTPLRASRFGELIREAMRLCNDRFFERQGQLNTAVASFFSFDWVDPTARCLICSNCGYIHWFLPEKMLRKARG